MNYRQGGSAVNFAQIEKLSVLAAVLFLSSALGSVQAAPIVLDFEDLSPSTLDVIPDGYHGFEWRGVGEISNLNMAFYAPTLRGECSTTGGIFAGGYCNGTTSGKYVAYRGTAAGAATIRRERPFNFESAFVTSPWNNAEDLVVRGFRDGIELFNDHFVIDTLSPTKIELNYLSIDTITFLGTGGVNAGYGSSGEGVVIDDFAYSDHVVPEPNILALVAVALVGLGLVGRRRLRQLPRNPGMQSTVTSGRIPLVTLPDADH